MKRLFYLGFLFMLTGCGSGVDIWKAIENEDLIAIQKYALNRGDLDAGAKLYGKTPLVHAIQFGRKKSYQTLLDSGANPNTMCPGKGAAMHYAAMEPDPFWLEASLKAKGDPNLINTQGKSMYRDPPLTFAISSKRLENVRLLCEAGAEINAYDHRQLTPLAYAARLPDFAILLYLLQKEADIRKPARRDNTFIDNLQTKIELVKSGSYNPEERKQLAEVVDWLKAHNFDPEKAVWDGNNWKQP